MSTIRVGDITSDESGVWVVIWVAEDGSGYQLARKTDWTGESR